MLTFDDQELGFVIKSCSIDYDAINRRIDRLTGRHHDDAIDEVALCNRTLEKAKDELLRRHRSGERIYPIGVDPNRKTTP